jgi:hypothetical protein
MHYDRWRRNRHNVPEPALIGCLQDFPPTPHDQIPTPWQHATRADNDRFRQLADRIIAANTAAAARYRMQNARDDAAEHAVAAD